MNKILLLPRPVFWPCLVSTKTFEICFDFYCNKNDLSRCYQQQCFNVWTRTNEMLHSRFGPQKLMPWQGWSPKNWFKCLWRTIKTFIGLPLWWPSFCTSIILCTKAFHFLPLYLSLFPLTYFDVRKQQRKETEKNQFFKS